MKYSSHHAFCPGFLGGNASSSFFRFFLASQLSDPKMIVVQNAKCLDKVRNRDSPITKDQEVLYDRSFCSENAVKCLWRFKGKVVRPVHQVVDRVTQMSARNAGGRGFGPIAPRHSSF